MIRARAAQAGLLQRGASDLCDVIFERRLQYYKSRAQRYAQRPGRAIRRATSTRRSTRPQTTPFRASSSLGGAVDGGDGARGSAELLDLVLNILERQRELLLQFPQVRLRVATSKKEAKQRREQTSAEY